MIIPSRRSARVASTVTLALFTLLYSAELSNGADAENPLPAFPGAVGYGATSVGGRGGDVYHVTSLLDDGSPGTLRHGIQSARGPRTIVFEVGGIVELESTLRIEAKKLTIAGQTAPGGGITLAKYGTRVMNSEDVIIRYLRCRCGDFNAQRPGAGPGGLGVPGVGNGKADLIGDQGDALSVSGNSNRVILDHCSASWSMDETLSVTVAKNVTVQHCLISESLNHSFHHTGAHGLGSLIRGDISPEDRAAGTGGYTFFRNLYAHHSARNPAVGGQQKLDPGQSAADRREVDLEFVNNVVYDWGRASGHTVGGESGRVNYLGNFLVAGPSTLDDRRALAFVTRKGKLAIHQAGNYIDSDVAGENDAVLAGLSAFRVPTLVEKPFDMPKLPTVKAPGAYERVLSEVGASLHRDAIDLRILNQVKTRKGRIIDSQKEVGGLVPIASGRVPVDSDRDGMADEFEKKNGLNPKDPADRNSKTLSQEGYTNLEVYLDSLTKS